MADFNFALFTQPDQYEETLLRDRKAMVEYWRDDKKAEFVRDVIALANTARMLGEPAYLILGVQDNADGTSNDICGIGKMFERQVRQGKTKQQARETLRQELPAIVHRYITPLLSPRIEFAEIDQKIVGYVLISPLAGEPFRISQEFRSGNQTYLRPGQCWLRFGESKGEVSLQELAPNDDKLRYSYAEVPYVLPSIWQRYFEETQRNLQKLMEDAPEKSACQELHDGKGIPIRQIVDEFLAQNDDRLLVLQGVAGCGKSLFLQQLVMRLAEQGEQEMKDAQRLEQFTPPNGLIPIFHRLRDLTPKARKESGYFTKILCNALAPLWESNPNGRRPSHPERLFDNPRLHWLIVLDGLDELGVYERRHEFLRVLTEFMQTYSRLKVILTTRPSPGVLLAGIENSKLVEIAPLDESQVEGFFQAYRSDQNDEVIDAFLRQSKFWEDAWKLVRIPAYMTAAAQAIGVVRKITDVQEKPEDAPLVQPEKRGDEQKLDTPSVDVVAQSNAQLEGSLETEEPVLEEPTERLGDDREDYFVQTLPQLLDRIYGAFWEREKIREIVSDGNHLRCATHEIAAKRMKFCPDRVQRETARRLLKEKGIRWVLEMGIFQENEDEHLFFNTPSTQIYSAAKQLQGDVEGRFWDDARRYMRRWQDDYRADVETFYQDLTGNSLPSILQPQGGSNG